MNNEIINGISNKRNHNLSRGLRVQRQKFRIANVINTVLFDLLCKPSAAEKVEEDFNTKGYNRSNSKAKLVNNILTL